MILRNDKVTLIKEFGKLTNIGETYEVANITDTKIVLREEKTKIAVCAIDTSEFDTYFVKLDYSKPIDWTDWYAIGDSNGCILGYYRTNCKKVQVRIGIGEKSVKAEANCNTKHDDIFNLTFGIMLAYHRCHNKCLERMKQKHFNAMVSIEEEINKNNSSIIEMISSLNKHSEDSKGMNKP